MRLLTFHLRVKKNDEVGYDEGAAVLFTESNMSIQEIQAKFPILNEVDDMREHWVEDTPYYVPCDELFLDATFQKGTMETFTSEYQQSIKTLEVLLKEKEELEVEKAKFEIEKQTFYASIDDNEKANGGLPSNFEEIEGNIDIVDNSDEGLTDSEKEALKNLIK